MFPDRLRLPLSFDPALLARDLAALSATPWTRHFVHDNYDGDWSAIPLRSAEGETHPIRMIGPHPGAKRFVDTPLLDACPYFRQVLATFACEIRGARLMRLTPGSVIKEHDDPYLSAEDGRLRLHIPVLTNPDVDFQLSRRRIDMPAGSVWYLRLTDPHRVANRVATDRVHLVFDAEVNPWLTGQLRAAQQAADSASVLPDR